LGKGWRRVGLQELRQSRRPVERILRRGLFSTFQEEVGAAKGIVELDRPFAAIDTKTAVPGVQRNPSP
jgi:hypothetical protein